MKKNKGFTFIELLVIIAIIGILSSVVLASLNSAKLKAKNKVVESQLSGMRVQAELYYRTHTNSYLGLCGATSASNGLGGTGSGLLLSTKNATAIPSTLNLTYGTAGSHNVVTCHDSATSWAVEAPLHKSVSGTPEMFCVDDRTIAPKSTTTALLEANDTICN